MPAEGRVLPSRAGRRQRPPRRFADVSGPWLQQLAAAMRSPRPTRRAQQATQLTQAAANVPPTSHLPAAHRRPPGHRGAPATTTGRDGVDGPHGPCRSRSGDRPCKPWITPARNRMPQGNRHTLEPAAADHAVIEVSYPKKRALQADAGVTWPRAPASTMARPHRLGMTDCYV